MKNGPHGLSKRTPPGADPDFIAIEALTFIAGNPEHAERFMALSGIGADGLRRAAADPGFLLGVMDHLVAHEALLLLFAEAAGLAPETVVQAQERMARR